ncbi:MAG TPA: NIPSNAP family protein [Streptosporangiaceae bacterium]
MDGVRYPIMELRQYTLRPGQRDGLIDLFDREFVETQEAEGMAIPGQFRDLDRPDRFVWLRGFTGMECRLRGLTSFYSGPAWKAHSAQANATMIDTDDVLLLRPVTSESGLPPPAAGRPPADHTAPPRSRVLVTICYRDHPFDEAFADFFGRQVRPVLASLGAAPLACFQTEHAENNFPALPVRTGENAFAWFTLFASHAHLRDHLDRLEHAGLWQDQVLPSLLEMLSGAPQQLRLAPTARSLLR